MINESELTMDGNFGAWPDDGNGPGPAAEGGAAPADRPETPPTPEQRICDLEEKLLRAKADYANLQRWAREQRADAVRYANAELFTALLPIVDDFERCITLKAESPDAEALLSGIKLVHQNLTKLLSSYDVAPIGAAGEPFDPEHHEAMMRQEAAGTEPHTVLRVVLKGYRMGERILRPAKVVVAAAPSTGEPRRP